MKHAYLILAHHEFALLQILISCLDDNRNDIYVHIDRKVKESPTLKADKAGLFILKDRVDVRWGDVSQIEAEYALFETAVANGPYQYYHLLSGVDLPLKSQDYIHSFFDSNSGKEFVGFTITEFSPQIVRKVQRWHLFPKQFGCKSLAIRIPRAVFLRVQEFLGIRRNKSIDFKKGPNWVSITDALARYVIAHKQWSLNTFRNTFCCDELFIQTLCWDSPFKERVYDVTGGIMGCMREIGWKNGRLIDWCSSDLEYLKASPALFARKFNSRDLDFIRVLTNMA